MLAVSYVTQQSTRVYYRVSTTEPGDTHSELSFLLCTSGIAEPTELSRYRGDRGFPGLGASPTRHKNQVNDGTTGADFEQEHDPAQSPTMIMH